MADSPNKKLSKLIRRLIYTPESRKVLDQIEDQLGLINTNATSSTHYEVDNTFSSSLSFENTNKLMQLSSRYTQSGTISYTKSNSELGTIRHYVQGDGSAVNFTSDFIINQNGDITASGQVLSLDVIYEILFVSDGEKIATSVVATPAAAIDNIAPTLSSSEVGNNGDSVQTLTFSESVNVTGVTGMVLNTDAGTGVTIESVISGSGTTTVQFQLSRAIAETEILTIDISPTNDITDLAGNPFSGVTGYSTTNNISAPTTVIFSQTFNDSSLDTTNLNIVDPMDAITIGETSKLELTTDNSGDSVDAFVNQVNTQSIHEKSGEICMKWNMLVEQDVTGFRGLSGIYWPDTAGGINRVIVGKSPTQGNVNLSYIISEDGTTVDSGTFTGTDVFNSAADIRIYYDGTNTVIVEVYDGANWVEKLNYTLAAPFSGNGYPVLSANNPSGQTIVKRVSFYSLDLTNNNNYSTVRP